MPVLTFKATPFQKTWLHKQGGKREEDDVQAPTGKTWKIIAPVILKDGDTVEMDAFDASWALNHYPRNFALKDAVAVAVAVAATPAPTPVPDADST